MWWAGTAAPAAAQELLVRLSRTTSAQLANAPSAPVSRMLGLDRDLPARRLARTGPLSDVVALAFDDSLAMLQAQAKIAAAPGVVSVQPNVRYRIDGFASAPVDAPWDSLAHLVSTGVREAQRVTTGKRRVRVALLDSGVWFEHPALAHAVWTNPRETPSNGLDDDGNGFVDDVRGWDFVDRLGSPAFGDVRARDNDPSDDNTPGGGRSHGTYVAGVVAAQYLAPTAATGPGFALGVAPGVSVVPLRVCAADGGCDDDDVAAALVYAADMGFEVVNMSFGTEYVSEVLRDAIAYAASKGVVLVASAGNQPVARPHYPSDYPDVLSAVWLSEDGSRRAGNAQFGPGVDLGAPASQTRTTAMPLPDQMGKPGVNYLRLSGSSFAAPVVAGVAALVLSQDSSLSAASVRAILTATATDLGAAGWDEQTGHGRVQADRALLRALPANVSISSPEQDDGTAASRLPIVGTVLDPSFVSYDLFYAQGDSVTTAWTRIGSTQTTPRLRDTLAVWNTAGLAEGVYTLRLSVALREGGTIEERRRVWIDRTPPRVTVVRALAGYQTNRYAALYEVTTDDLTRVQTEKFGVPSDRIARRHGLVASFESLGSGAVTHSNRIVATNRAGLQTVVDAPVVTWGRSDLDPTLLAERPLSAPHGILLPKLTDFDGDGLRELTLNRANDEATSDTTLIYEWNGADVARVQKIVVDKSAARPRDAGDTDGDGRGEILIQSGGTSGVIEATRAGAFPSELAYVSPDTLFAARFADLDRDGRGEIIGHNGKAWRIYEWNGAAYARVAALPNPTPLGTGEVRDNLYSEPDVAVGDFDGDGQTELAVIDFDGDLVVYEARGDNRYEVAWQEASDRYAARPKMTTGDFTGDGRPDFVVLRENYEPLRSSDREQEPAVATFALYTGTGDNAYRQAGSVSFPLLPTRYTSTAPLDLDGDGRDELVVAAGPRLYVFAWQDGAFVLRFYRGLNGRSEENDGLRSVTMATGDLDGDGAPELIASMGNRQLARFVPQRSTPGTVPPPVITYSAPNGPTSVLLAWQARSADSTIVYRHPTASAPLERVGYSPSCCVFGALSAPPGVQTYYVRAWKGGVASALSAGVAVAPGPSTTPVIASAVRVDTNVVRFTLTGAFSTDDLVLRGIRAYVYPPEDGAAAVYARTVVSATQFTGFVATFDRKIPAGWNAGLLGAGAAVPLDAAPTAPSDGLLLASAQVTGSGELRLTFSQALDPSTVRPGAFRLAPGGTVTSATIDPSDAKRVILRFSGAVVGATGLSTSITASDLRSASGELLNADGRAVRLTQAAADLSGAYVFPNPVRASEAPEGAMVAGLTVEADVTILSVDGRLIRRLEERDGDGGLRWDLRDDAGAAVPSGVYLVRIATPDGGAKIVSVAVIR